MNKTVKLEKWKVAQKRHCLSDKQVQMARELGFNPDKLGKLDNHKQEPWKTPLPQHIENLYYKRFGKEIPDTVKSIAQLLKEDKIKKEEQKKEKEHKRKAKDQNNESPADENSKDVEIIIRPLTLSARLKLYNEKPKNRMKLEGGDTPEAILLKEAHIFDEAFDIYEKESVTLPELGFVLKKIHPGYKPRRYGCKTLGAIYEKLDKYEVVLTPENTYNVIRKKKNDEN